MQKHAIYRLYNKITRKSYIGQTKNFEKRMRYYKTSHCKSQPKLHNSIKKYGWDSFEVSILEETTIVFVDFWERHYIQKFDSVSNGYNCEYGGSKNKIVSEKTRKKQSEAIKGEKHPNWGKNLSEQTRKKQSEAMKGKYRGEKNHMWGKTPSKETKQKISETLKGEYVGELNPMWGRVHSEETRKKQSEAKKGKYRGEKNPKSKKVICIKTGKIWSCAVECAKENGINCVTLRSKLNGHDKNNTSFVYIEYDK